jgi:putative PIN family toxin of toxin-antitoxin system
MDRTKVVLDTNILVSIIGWGEKPEIILGLCITDDIKLIISPSILDEFKETIFLKRFDFIEKGKKEKFVSLLMKIAEVVEPSVRLNVITEDEDDNRIIECAIAGGADFIISGDKDLLRLGKFGGIRIVSPSQFLKKELRGIIKK